MRLYLLTTLAEDMSGNTMGSGAFLTHEEAQQAMKQCCDEAFEVLCDSEEITREEAEDKFEWDLFDWDGYLNGDGIWWHWEISTQELEVKI